MKDQELSSLPNDKYKKFFEKFEEINFLPVAEWKKPHLLGYFCFKYKKCYNIEYSWKFNNPSPAKCFEVWQISALCAKLSTNPQIVKDYIDWTFNNLIPKTKRRFTSISFITKDESVNPYKMNILFSPKKTTINRTDLLPSEYISVFNDLGIKVNDYGDLAFLNKPPISANLQQAFDKLVQLGFNLDSLNKII